MTSCVRRRAGIRTRDRPPAASSVAPPLKTARRRNSACSSAARQIVRPADRRRQRLQAGRGIARAVAQQRKAIGHLGQQRLRGQDGDPRRGQLDGQRQAIERAADRRYRRRIALAELKRGPHRLRPLDEEAHRRRSAPAARSRCCRGRQREGLDRQHLLPAHVERRPAGGQHLHRGARGQQQRDRPPPRRPARARSCRAAAASVAAAGGAPAPPPAAARARDDAERGGHRPRGRATDPPPGPDRPRRARRRSARPRPRRWPAPAASCPPRPARSASAAAARHRSAARRRARALAVPANEPGPRQRHGQAVEQQRSPWWDATPSAR